MHTSLEVQNQIINCCQEFILEKIAAVLKINKYYSMAADEATDCDMKEKLALILWFVDKNDTVREEFVRITW